MLGIGKVAAIGLGAAAIGAASEISNAAVDASMDVAFGAPDADKYFVGKELSARYMLGRAMGNAGGFFNTVGGTAMQATDPLAAMDYSGGAGVPGATASVAGGVAGAAAGAYGASKIGGGLKGKILGAAIGGLAGGSMPLVNAGATMSANSSFFNETAYGRSASQGNAMGLSAVGDIVLGMHNSRNGY